ncbi:uncharacterized protein LOC117317594 [Pecten maximus]|uniref:uncharacterized protein LOC117317594 n=1 Tax=Pecten maximus TaxID=6579 RepID=UPI0014580195|nr:uncharacterized protein LOC117317594 [Pecten maximus]
MDIQYMLLLVGLTITSTTCTGISGLKMLVGNCVVTKIRQERPSIKRDHYCIRVGQFYVCREWQCSRVSCLDDKPGIGNCRVCPGTCIDGGKVYREGQVFQSVDGVNMCSCGAKNVKRCSHRRRVTFISLCLI